MLVTYRHDDLQATRILLPILLDILICGVCPRAPVRGAAPTVLVSL
jgi:hypothetical protein